MGMNTSSLIGLLVIGLVILVWGGHFWWVGIAIVLISMALAVGGGEEVPMPQQLHSVAVSAKAMASPAKAEEGFDIYDFKWSPTTFADGMVGNKMEDEFGPGAAIGSRSSAFTQDMGPIRFKDDMRFRLYHKEADPEFAMCSDADIPKPLTAWDFRTRKDVFPGLHTGVVKTVTSPDDMTNPGLGSPNDWIREEMKRRKQR